ncbi:hypothetical protein RSAG8_05627, partial [Rhizoctonia solani AG-8 WAC10335]
MESRKRAKQPVEGDKNNIKRAKHTIKALFHSEGSTGAGTGSPSNTLPRVNPVENEQSYNHSNADSNTNQLSQLAHPVEENLPELTEQQTSTHFAMATNQNLSTSQTAEDLVQGSYTPRNPQVDGTKRKGLKFGTSGVLRPVANAFGPIKQAAEIFVECVDSYKVAGKTKVEHDELIARLEGLFDDIAGEPIQSVPHLLFHCPLVEAQGHFLTRVSPDLNPVTILGPAKGLGAGICFIYHSDIGRI